MKVKLGTTPLRVEYTDDELKDRVLSYIDSNTDGVGFRDICDHLLMIANDEGKIIKDSDTDYEWMELDRADTLRVSRALWKYGPTASLSTSTPLTIKQPTPTL